MPKIAIQDGPHLVPNAPQHAALNELDKNSSLEEEIGAMLGVMRDLYTNQPDVIIFTCMALMARCTELHVQLVRVERLEQSASKVRTMQLRPLMELIDFTFKAASRLVEIARQEVELSR